TPAVDRELASGEIGGCVEDHGIGPLLGRHALQRPRERDCQESGGERTSSSPSQHRTSSYGSACVVTDCQTDRRKAVKMESGKILHYRRVEWWDSGEEIDARC